MQPVKVAIIGGSGVYNQSFLETCESVEVETIYGPAALKIGTYHDREVVFVARHGSGHSVPPHRVNYRANIAALKKIGVSRIVATAAVGSLREKLSPGKRVIVDQFIDFSKNRPLTFYDGGESPVIHTDFTEPYCPQTRAAITRAAEKVSQEIIDGGCYICTEGPRFETAAEIRMFKNWGADVVGMTGVPEVVLAREAGLCYASICLPTNFAAGVTGIPLEQEEVLLAMDRDREDLEKLLAATVEEIEPAYSCRCREAGKYWPGG